MRIDFPFLFLPSGRTGGHINDCTYWLIVEVLHFFQGRYWLKREVKKKVKIILKRKFSLKYIYIHIYVFSKIKFNHEWITLTLLRNGHIYPGDPIRGYEALLMFVSRCLRMAGSLLVLLLCWDVGLCHEQTISDSVRQLVTGFNSCPRKKHPGKVSRLTAFTSSFFNDSMKAECVITLKNALISLHKWLNAC